MASKELQLMGVRLVNEEDYGKSAFEIAQDHGFEGTEEEWLESLKPVKGVDYNTPEDKQELLNATVSVFQNTKADSIQHKTGSTIVASNSAHLPLNGFKLLGKTTQNGAPTPDAPVALESAGENGSVTVNAMGKNLLDIKNAKVYHQNPHTQSVQYNITDTGVFATPMRELSNCWQRCGLLIGTVAELAGRTITLSCEYASNVSNNDTFVPYISIAFSNVEPCVDNNDIVYNNGGYIGEIGSYTEVSFGGKGVASVTYTVTGDEVGKYIIAIFLLTYGGDFTIGDWVEYSNIQIEYGETATAYEPYKEPQTLTIPTPNGLPGVPVKSGGNYTDENCQQWICDEIDFVRGVYVKRTNQITFDGSERDWRMGNAKAPFATPEIENLAPFNGNDSQALCAKYQVATYNESWANYDFMVTRQDPFNNQFTFKHITISTLDEWKAYLTSDPVTIQYVLAEPIITPLTAEQLEAYENAALHTYAPTTVLANDANAEMELTYYTPSTAVPMVHGPADKGKTFTVDEHGCVTLTKDNPVIACGETILNGVTWYYRKWADGFAELWSTVRYVGAYSGRIDLEYLLPFNINPYPYFRVYANILNPSGYERAPMFANAYDPGEGYIGISIDVPVDPGDSTITVTGDIYLACWWKRSEEVKL